MIVDVPLIQVDEFDMAERKQLNFGHTFGHALEVGSDHGIPHGLAVASGMRAALLLSPRREIYLALNNNYLTTPQNWFEVSPRDGRLARLIGTNTRLHLMETRSMESLTIV